MKGKQKDKNAGEKSIKLNSRAEVGRHGTIL